MRMTYNLKFIVEWIFSFGPVYYFVSSQALLFCNKESIFMIRVNFVVIANMSGRPGKKRFMQVDG